MIRVTVFNEGYHDVTEEKVKEIYPCGIHGQLKSFLESDDVKVRIITQYDENLNTAPDCGITKEILDDTDVIIWWGHMKHNEVPDEIADMVADYVRRGMGPIFLHSGHHAKPFKKLMGTTCNLKWRDGVKERLWNINPAHPIMQGIGEYFDIPEEEMYGERYDIPTPDDLLMLGAYSTHEVFRSLCVWQRGYGKIAYFQPGHETNPTYHIPEVQTIIKNAVRWAMPLYRVDEIPCPHYPEIEL